MPRVGIKSPGQQAPLIDDESWSTVRDQLAANTSNHRRRAKAAETLAEIRKITGGGADFALEESAEPAVFRLAVDVLRGLGTCILVGNARAGTEVSFAAGRPDCARRDIA